MNRVKRQNQEADIVADAQYRARAFRYSAQMAEAAERRRYQALDHCCARCGRGFLALIAGGCRRRGCKVATP
jgi:hypothetical protein